MFTSEEGARRYQEVLVRLMFGALNVHFPAYFYIAKPA